MEKEGFGMVVMEFCTKRKRFLKKCESSFKGLKEFMYSFVKTIIQSFEKAIQYLCKTFIRLERKRLEGKWNIPIHSYSPFSTCSM